MRRSEGWKYHSRLQGNSPMEVLGHIPRKLTTFLIIVYTDTLHTFAAQKALYNIYKGR